MERTRTFPLLALFLITTSAFAQGTDDERLKKLEDEFRAYKERTERELADLRKEVSQSRASTQPTALDQAIADLQARVDAISGRTHDLEATRGQRIAYLDISFDLLSAMGWSSATNAELDIVEPGGHDPNQRGFTIQNAELSFQGAVDPNFRGDSHIVLQIDKNGETNVELEEAYLTTTSLPEDLQIKAGQFLTEFGRMNPTHPHTWDFVDQPLVNNRMFGGDGLRGPGARVSWLAPTPFYMELISGILNAQGETQTSFLATPDTFAPIAVSGGGTFPGSAGGHPYIKGDPKSLGDMVYSERIASSFDLSDESTLLFGGSALFGPNSSGGSGDTQIYGLDVYYKWKPLANDQGFPFFAIQAEAMKRRYRSASFNGDLDGDGTNEFFSADTFRDSGFYAQATWGFARPWVAGLRVDWVNGNGASTGGDGTLDRRWRVSPDLTYYPSEFSKIRIQANLDKVQELDDRTFVSVWIQFEILFGAHGAHKF